MRRKLRKGSALRRAHFSHCCSCSLLVTLLKALAVLNMRKPNLTLNFVEEVLVLASTSC